MKKSFSEKLEELKPKPRDLNVIERKLLPRLKFMAYVMYSLCIASVGYAIFAPKVDETEIAAIQASGISGSLALDAIVDFFARNEEIELSPTEVLNFYLVGLTFASIGGACSYLYRRKKKILFAHVHHHQPPPQDKP